MTTQRSILERRSQYPLHERLVVYDPETIQKQGKPETVLPSLLQINGVNLLNRDSLDTQTVMKRIIKKKQTHNRIERRRRVRLNTLFSELSDTLPSMKHKTDNYRAEILQEAINYIKQIQSERHAYTGYSSATRLNDTMHSKSTTIQPPSRPPPQSYFESIISFK
ncbi:hypothetical protein EDC96DRAFT_514979 [Choanephora cucurbitarum]|nr:hypothetical protein EDC96DRAFT_514979 [Choanephora cucurbitarum]